MLNNGIKIIFDDDEYYLLNAYCNTSQISLKQSTH